jgi:tetratricopeptide (TPR) repeat protein
MQDLWENGILVRILALMVIIALLGLSPQSHLVTRELVQASRAQAPEVAARSLAMVAEHLPWRQGIWEQAGHYALEGEDAENAILHFKKAAATGDLSLEGYLEFGDAYVEVGNPFTAAQIWKAANQIFGVRRDSLTRLADLQRDLGQYPDLIATLKALMEFQASDPDPLSTSIKLNYELGLLLAAQNPPAAPPYLLQAAELDPSLRDASQLAFTIQRALPNENPVYTAMAASRKLAALNRWALALYALQGVVDGLPDYAEAWAYLGETLQHQAEPATTEAYVALEKALLLDPQSLPANIFMALYWQRAGDPERAYQYLSMAAKIDPDNPDILVDLGAAAAVLGDLESAATNYREAIELTSRSPVYLRKMVEFCLRTNFNLRDTALPLAREALDRDATNPASLDVMGQVFLRLGDLFSAERFLVRALQQDPDYAPTHLHLGVLYSLQDKPDLAIQAFTKAVSLAPGSPTADQATRLLNQPTNP